MDAEFWIDTETGTIINCNKAAEKLLGKNKKEIIGTSFTTLHPPEEITYHTELLKKIVKEGKKIKEEGKIITKNGVIKTINITASTTTVGKKTIIQKIFHDITEHKRIEREQEIISHLIHRLTETVTMKEVGQIIAQESRHLFNHDFFSISYYDRMKNQSIGIYCEDTPADKTEPIEMTPISVPIETIKSSSSYKGKSTLVNRMEEHPKSSLLLSGDKSRLSRSLMFVPILWADNSIGVLSVQSYTPGRYADHDLHLLETLASQCSGALLRIFAEEERKKLEVQLLQSQKMEAIGELAGGVAHDFNNLLTAITGYAEIILDSIKSDNPMRGRIEEIKKAGDRATSLTSQLLAFSRRQIIQPKVLNLNTLVTELGTMLKRLLGEDISFSIMLEPNLHKIKVDPIQLEQVIMNLVVNARDAMPKGGTIIIKTDNVTIDEQQAKMLPYMRPGKFIRLYVEDNGIGMNKETIQHIFEPFFSTKEESRGTGLGLSVVYGIVKQHNGWINVYSEIGKGSTFKVYLPVFQGTCKDKEEDAISLKALRGNGEKILLVEDEETVRRFTIEVLQKNGYDVISAKNANEALTMFNKGNGDIQLVFSDIVLPDKSGLDFVDEILSCNPKISILLTSGYVGKKSQWSLVSQRGYKFIQKPYAVGNLLQAIKESISSSKKHKK